MTDLKRPVSILAATLTLVTGCTAQLTSNTLDMQESYRGLFTKQILYNIGQAMDEKSTFFPSQFLIGTGAAETTNSIAPSIGIPLPTTTITNTLAQAVGAVTTNTLTNTSQTAFTNATLGVTLTDAWRYSWGVNNRTDPDELRRLRALYLYAAGVTPHACRNDDGGEINGQDNCFIQQYVMQGGRQSVNQAFVDQPGCVLCVRKLRPGEKPADNSIQTNLQVNKRLRPGFITKRPTPGFHAFASYGSMRFYVSDEGGEEAFADFMLFILEAMSSTQPVPFGLAPPKPGPGAGGAAPASRMPLPPKSQFQQPFNFSLPL
jgi:hypothetical protein